MIASHLIALQVVIPMMAAPICAMLVRHRFPWLFTALVTLCAFVIALYLLMEVSVSGPISYAMGNWLPPIGIEYRIDLLNAFILVLITGIAFFLMPFAYHSVPHEVPHHQMPLFYTTFLLCLSGLIGMTISNDAFNIYVFLEIASLATYTLIAMGTDRRCLMASYKYLILGTIGATFYLIGIGLLYSVTGTLNISDLASRIEHVDNMRPVITGFSFIVIGLILKSALFPLHLWLVNSYAYAPSFVTSFLAATATKVSLYVLIRILFNIFGKNYVFDDIIISDLLRFVLMPMALLAILAASLTAVFQQNVKRMLAYSSVAQIGYIILGITLMSKTGLVASMVHIFNHALAKAGLFIACGCVFYRVHGNNIKHFAGLGKVMPFTMAGFVICGLSLIGVPFTAGFISKWQLTLALIEAGLWPVVLLVMVSSLIAVMYIWKVIEVAYFSDYHGSESELIEVPMLMRLSLWVMAGASIYFGIFTEHSLQLAHYAVTLIIENGGTH